MSFNDLISAIGPVLPDNQSVALEIEGVDSKDYVVIKTTDGSESITLKAGGSGTVINETGQMKSTASGGWMLISSDPSDTVPNIMPSMSDPNTGIGHYGGTSDSDALSLIAGGVEGVRVVEDSSAATIQFGQDNYDPMIQQASGTAAGSVGYSFKADTDTGLSSGGESNSLQLVVGTIPAIHCRKDDDTGVAYVGIGGSAYDASVNNTLLQLNGDSDEAELAFKLSGGTTTTMGYRGQAVFSIDANGGFQVRNQGGSQHLNISTAGVITAKAGGIQYRSGTGSDTDTTEPVYLADTNGTMIVDFSKGNFGDITLAANVTAVKFFNVPADGTVATVTAKITQDSSARTFDYSDSAVTVYSDGGSTAVTGEIKFSGGAHHVQSTGSGAVDLVSFTCIPSGSTFNIYAAVVGQAFA